MSLSIIVPSKNEPRVHEVVEFAEKSGIASQIVVYNDRYGHGKGKAVREALSLATGNVVAFIDGDMDIHPRMLSRLIPYLVDYDIVVGSKGLSGDWTRKILTILSRIYIRLMFNLDVDTQTGIKLFRRNSLPTWESDSFAYDVEILAKARKAGARMIEVPIDAYISKKMKAKCVLNALKESLKIWLALKSR